MGQSEFIKNPFRSLVIRLHELPKEYKKYVWYLLLGAVIRVGILVLIDIAFFQINGFRLRWFEQAIISYGLLESAVFIIQIKETSRDAKYFKSVEELSSPDQLSLSS